MDSSKRFAVQSVRLVVVFLCSVFLCSTARTDAQDVVPAVVVTRGPYLQGLFDTTVEVRFETSAPVVASVRGNAAADDAGADPALAFDVEGVMGASHRIRIDGLRPDTDYEYVVVAREDADGAREAFAPLARFRTAPAPGSGSFRAVAIGDSGIDSPEQHALAEVIESFAPDIFLHTGDLLYVASVDRGVFAPYRRILTRSCFFPTRGNHDFGLEVDGTSWRDLFAVPNDDPERTRVFYSYDWGPAHFLVLDYHSAFADDSAQTAFARADLAAARARDVRWLIVYQHLPVYSIGAYADLEHPMRERLRGLADEFSVDLVLSGHDHNYQRTFPVGQHVVRDAWQGDEAFSPRGTVYVVTGGGGAVLYGMRRSAAQVPFVARFEARHHAVVLDISPEALLLRAVSLEGEVFDAMTLRKDRAPPPFRFVAGDATGDSSVGLSDAVAILNALFLGVTLPCPAAARVASDGPTLRLTQAIYLLEFLFRAGPPPLAPFPDCGEVPGADDGFCYRSGC